MAKVREPRSGEFPLQKLGAFISLKHSLVSFDRLESLQVLLRVSTKKEIIDVLLSAPIHPVDVNPVLVHLDGAISQANIDFTCEEIDNLELELEALSAIIDTEIIQQVGTNDYIGEYKLLRWVGNEDALIGVPCNSDDIR